jgi:hypothetical protein
MRMTDLQKRLGDMQRHIHSLETILARDGAHRLVMCLDVDDPHEGVIYYKVSSDNGKEWREWRSLTDALADYRGF